MTPNFFHSCDRICQNRVVKIDREEPNQAFKKTTFSEPDFSRRLLTPNGRLWDLVLTGKEVGAFVDEVLEIEKTLKRLRVKEK